MELSPLVLASIITASAAITAAIFATVTGYFNGRIAKQNAVLQARIAQRVKRADFRQLWINNLRSSFIDFSDSLFWKGPPQDVERQLTKSLMQITLLMNKDDKDFEKLRQSMSKAMSDSVNKNSDGEHFKFVQLCQSILKREWEVTKKELALLEDDFHQ
jgi:hypothetical protein